jgi:Berberine and berberine like
MEGRVKATYGDNYERLVAIENNDPDNFFRGNQNIKPGIVAIVPSAGFKGAGV